MTRLYITCLVIQVDRSDVALGATAIRTQCPRSCAWTVATPPVQAFSAVASSASPWWDQVVQVELKRKRVDNPLSDVDVTDTTSF